MRPTDFAKFQFDISADWAQRIVMGNGSDPKQDMLNLAAAVRDMAGGLANLAVGLRATYMLLEEVKKSVAEQNKRSGLRP